MSKIELLDDLLISKIAAGEVIERPASVVKELVENALDAGATAVEVELEDGGRERIVVRDDGSGMSAADLERAFERHATSKIHSFDDLEGVRTLGFRGEALAAIASVSRVECLSAEAAGDGFRLEMDGGRRIALEPASAPRGTQFEIRDLFFNVPARRQFLKTASTEMRRCMEVVQGYALAHPTVRFELVHAGRTLLQAMATSNDSTGRLERIAQLFGADLAGQLVPLHNAGAGAEVSGFVGTPAVVRGRRNFVFVDGRLLRDRALLGVFYGAVRDVWKTDRFPPLFLYVDVAQGDVDVNVHPQKSEVRFRSNEPVRRVARAIRDALEATRGAAAAPVQTLSGSGMQPELSWQGLGGESPSGGSGAAAGVGEATAASGWPGGSTSIPPSPSPGVSLVGGAGHGRIAGVQYARSHPRRVPLSGRVTGGLDALRLLGHYKGSLILLEGPDALFLVDQHAAHERILFEQLSAAIEEQQPRSQRLLSPENLDYGADLNGVLGAFADRLEECGFELSVLSDGTLGLMAVPAPLRLQEAREVLGDLAARFRNLDPREAAVGSLRSGLLESYVASRACRSAVKIHRPLNASEMERLVADLFDCEQPYSCPHGRPTVLKMDDAELERRFERR